MSIAHRLLSCVPLAVTLLIFLPAAAAQSGRDEHKDEPAADSSARASDERTKSRIDPKAREVVRKAWKLLSEAESFSTSANSTTFLTAAHRRIKIERIYRIAIERPNKFAFISQHSSPPSLLATTAVSNGEQLIMYKPSTGKYVVKEAPKRVTKLEEKVPPPARAMSGTMSALFLHGVIQKRKIDQLLQGGVQRLEYLGTEQVDGRKAHHVRFKIGVPTKVLKNAPEEKRAALESVKYALDVWIKTGDRPVLLKFVPDLHDEMPAAKLAQGAASRMLKHLTYKMNVRFDNWKINQGVPEKVFTFTPPPEAKKVEFLFPLLHGDGKEQGEKQ